MFKIRSKSKKNEEIPKAQPVKRKSEAEEMIGEVMRIMKESSDKLQERREKLEELEFKEEILSDKAEKLERKLSLLTEMDKLKAENGAQL